jgi:hypothetical protein
LLVVVVGAEAPEAATERHAGGVGASHA